MLVNDLIEAFSLVFLHFHTRILFRSIYIASRCFIISYAKAKKILNVIAIDLSIIFFFVPLSFIV